MLSHTLIYVSIYVLKNSTYICLVTYLLAYMWTYMAWKKSTCICLMSYMLLYNVRLPIYVVTHIDLYECQLSMCEHICAQKSICYHICEHILAEKNHIYFVLCHMCYCIIFVCPYAVTYIDLYECQFSICEHICAQKFDVYLTYDIYVTYMWTYTGSKIHTYLSCVICGYIKSRLHTRHALYE